MADAKNVCGNGWHGVRGTQISLENHTGGNITVSECGSSYGCTFAFSSPSPPFTVVPGTPTSATLIANPQPGVTYCYCTSGCPDKEFDTNPKTVIIS
jgi:hypothetical protein